MQELLDNRHSDRIHFRSISGERATLRAIKEAVSELYREALESSDPNILILLTGEGDAENKIRLKGDGTTTGEGLWRWMRELQIDSYPKSRTVTIILDHCRPKVIPSALRFPTTPNIPRSCFLLAVMMASCSVHNGGRSNLVININKELNRLLRFLEFAHKTIHGDPDRQCIHCSKNERCPMPPPRPQVPDWERAGSMKSVYNLVDRLSNMDFVSQVRDRFMGNRFFREANGLPAEDATFQPNPNSSHQAGQMSHIQGLSKPVDSGPTIQTGPH
ncbi:hypothetical protein B0J17DRAFT_172753 [Rhizoctonia solani]|nr:hypothetical protein B0J17DRAFT_172753 [Rhizoctonia solani]